VPLPPAQLAELEAAACELRAAFPAEFQNDFAVYDFGFYLHQEGFAGGVPGVFQAKVVEVEQESVYFLLFGRQLSRGGGVAEIWLKAKLPSTGAFSCQEADFYSMVEFRVRWAVSQAAVGGPGTPESIASAEVQGIQALRGWVEEIVACCDLNLRAGTGCSLCSWAMDDVLRYFASGGEAEQDSITLLSAAPSVEDSCLCATDYSPQSLEHTGEGYWVESHTAVNEFEFYGEAINVPALYAELQELAGVYASNGIGFYGAITDNAVFCASTGTLASRQSSSTPTIDEIEGRLRSSEAGVWIHIAYSDEQAYLLVKMLGPTGQILINKDSFPQYRSKLYFITERLKNVGAAFPHDFIRIFEASPINVEIRIEDIGEIDYNGSTSPLQEVMKSRHVIIRINNNRFADEEYCDRHNLGYLHIAKTLIHECVHAILKHHLMQNNVKGRTSDEKKRNLNMFNYSHYYSHYRQNREENLATWYTEHWILLNHYFSPLVQTLHRFNGRYGEERHYYHMTYNFSYKPTIEIEDLKRWTKNKYDGLGTVTEIEDAMEAAHEFLKENLNLPCQN
jgi:hypothetical protein